MENNKNKKSVKFQGDMLNFFYFIQVFVFTRNHHLNKFHFYSAKYWKGKIRSRLNDIRYLLFPFFSVFLYLISILFFLFYFISF